MGKLVFSHVIRALQGRPNKMTTLKTLMRLTGLEEEPIRDAISYARRTKPHFNQVIKVVARGQIWRYVPIMSADVAPTQPVVEPSTNDHLNVKVIESTIRRVVDSKPKTKPAIEPSTDGHLTMEMIGKTTDGNVIILQGSDGAVYGAYRM